MVENLTKRLLLVFYYAFLQFIPGHKFPGGRLGYRARRVVARRVFVHCGDNVVVRPRSYFGDGSRLSLGSRSQLGPNSSLAGPITIGSDVLMGSDVMMMATTHEYRSTDVPIMAQGAGEERPIIIGDGVWVGSRCIILPGVVVGDHSIIGAGSVVTKSFPDFSVIGGNPAKLLKSRKPEQEDLRS